MRTFIYIIVVTLLVSSALLIYVLTGYYTSSHNVDISFNGLMDASKLETAVDYYAVNKTDGSLISQPLITFYINAMDYLYVSPILFIGCGVLFGMCLMALIYEINNLEMRRR